MGQEFFINSQTLEDQVRKLLPSQGGAGAGFDLSASTQIIPIIDLTESAEGSNVRSDLQTSLSYNSISAYEIVNTTTTIINNTGYYRVFGNFIGQGAGLIIFRLTDGVTPKVVTLFLCNSGFQFNDPYDFNVFIDAGQSLTVQSTSALVQVTGCSRQIADITATLVNP